MEIIKRDGSRERYDAEKIARVMRAAFDGLGTECAAEDRRQAAAGDSGAVKDIGVDRLNTLRA